MSSAILITLIISGVVALIAILSTFCSIYTDNMRLKKAYRDAETKEKVSENKYEAIKEFKDQIKIHMSTEDLQKFLGDK